jgi:hypothetical protein
LKKRLGFRKQERKEREEKDDRDQEEKSLPTQEKRLKNQGIGPKRKRRPLLENHKREEDHQSGYVRKREREQ